MSLSPSDIAIEQTWQASRQLQAEFRSRENWRSTCRRVINGDTLVSAKPFTEAALAKVIAAAAGDAAYWHALTETEANKENAHG